LSSYDRKREIEDILLDVSFLDYEFWVTEVYNQGETHHEIYISYWEKDVDDPSAVLQQFGRSWAIELDYNRDQIVQTAFKACLTSMEHRTREGFKYKGERVFGPHFNLDDLVELCRRRREEE
jgi:hypothetical protein